MKYLYFIFIILSSVFGVSEALGQCTTNTYDDYGTPAPICGSGSYGAWESVTWAYSREYSIVNVTAGNTYQFQSYVTSNNGSRFTTITTTANVALSWGTTSDNNSVTWVATFTGQVRFWTHRNQGCGASTVNQTRRVRCNVPPCTGTEITLTMDDSFGDGWSGANLTITGDGGSTYGPFTLPNGSTGTETICLPDDCYSINVTGGTWPGEVSWNITENGSTLATGIAPDNQFEAFFTGSASCSPQPSPCDNIIPVTCGQTVNGSTVGSANLTVPFCNTGSGSAGVNVYSFTGTGDNITASLCGSTYDTKIWVFTGSCTGTLNCVVGNDDFCGLQSEVAFASISGVEYLIMVGGFGSAEGSYTLTLDCVNPNPSPANDLCANAISFSLSCGSSYTDNGSTTYATNTGNGPGCITAQSIASSVWYTFTGTGNNITASLCGSDYDTKIFIYTGSCGTLVCETGNDDFCGLQSEVNFNSTLGTQYTIMIAGFGSSSGNYTLTVNDSGSAPIPPTLSGGSTICYGEEITLTGSGGNAPPASWVWYENSVNGPQIGNGQSVTVTPSITTNYIVQVPGNGDCPSASSNIITVTLPVPDNTLSGNNAQATCRIAQNGYVHFLDPNGKLIASINSNGQNLGNVTATSYVEAAPLQVQDCASSILTSVLDRHWVITPQFQPTSSVEVVLPMEQNEEQSLVINANSNSNPDDDLVGLTDIVLTKYAGPENIDNDFQNNCFSQGGNETLDLFTQGMSGFVYDYWPSYTGNDLYASYDINSFSEFWLHGSSNLSPLPVSLTSFNANCQSDNFTEVTWETASEMNASHFIVERSRDGLSWSNEHEVDAAGNANTLNSYSFEDNNVGIGFEGYYRLRQVDFNGEQTLYGPISVQCDEIKNASMEVFPNPSSGSFTLLIFNNIEVEDAKIVILDVNGKVIQQQKTNINNGITTLLYDQKQLVKGMYYIRVIADGFDVAPKKLVIN